MKRSSAFAVVVLSLGCLFLPGRCFGQSENVLAASSAQPESAAASEPASPPQIRRGADGTRVGIGIKVSTLGIGGEVAVAVADRLNVRGGVTGFGFSRSLTADGIHYDGSLRLLSGDAHLDVFLFRSVHISPGLLFYNGNSVSASASVPAGQTFTVGGTEFESSSASPVTGSAKVNFSKVAPEITFGTGNLVPRGRRHWSITTEFGFAYAGAAKGSLGLAGLACAPPFSAGATCQSASSGTVATQVQAQQTKFNNTASSRFYYKILPIASVGFGYAF